MAGAARSALSGGQVGVPPDLRLKAGVYLADVVQRGEERQPRRRGIVERVQPTGVRQTLPYRRLGEELLEARADVG